MEKMCNKLGFEGLVAVEPQGKSGGIALFWKDKDVRSPYPNNLIEGFNDCLHEAELHDIDILGHQFTWEKGRNTYHWTEIRLDRVLANTQRLHMFDMAKVYNLEGSPSDHSPLLLCSESQLKGNRKHHFRFENAWLTEPMYFQIIKDCWEEDDNSSITKKLAKCAESLQIWGREITGCFSSRIRDCKAKLKILRGKNDNQSLVEYENAKQQLYLVLDQKEIFWRQRSKQFWLQVGEKNIKYFHASCNKRKRNNHIQKLKNEDGDWVEWEQQNRELLSAVTEKEVKNAVFNMHPDKASGPDGMTPAFFQKNWNTVGTEVVQMVRNFFVT
ncbi:uncharacterized protein LOC141663875 [Apium graveolens]|uniref:uncharacterized protein LOC141663875 n=1 Tax=Apium graveolens TaxID=4045 RepID=UPI003D7C0BE2